MYEHHDFKAVIRDNVSLEDFIQLYKTFSFVPYNEKWTDDKVKQVYESMLKDGHIYGIYDSNNSCCIGVITLTGKIQPLKFKEKALYIADLAVLYDYRKYNITEKLLDFAIEFAKAKGYKHIYLRTLEKDNSLDYEAFKNKKFKKMNDICQVVKMERTRYGKDEDCRIFMERDII